MKLKIGREMLWWLITALIIYFILYPIHEAIHYKFTYSNAFLIAVSLTYFRFIIFFKDLLIFRNRWVRVVIFIINIYLFIFIFSKVQDFNALFDTHEISEFANHLKRELSIYEESSLLRYIYHEIIFSVTSGLILVAALNVRILISYFKKVHRRLDPV